MKRILCSGIWAMNSVPGREAPLRSARRIGEEEKGKRTEDEADGGEHDAGAEGRRCPSGRHLGLSLLVGSGPV